MNSNFSAIQSFVCDLFENIHEIRITPQLTEILKQMITNKKQKLRMESCMIEYQVCDNEALYDVIIALETYLDCVTIEEVKEEEKVFQLVLRLWKKFKRILEYLYFQINRINRIPLADRLLI